MVDKYFIENRLKGNKNHADHLVVILIIGSLHHCNDLNRVAWRVLVINCLHGCEETQVKDVEVWRV
jgi:hypothetical protein